MPTELHKLKKILEKATFYSAYIEAGKKSQVCHIKARKSLADLLPNITRKARDSKEWGRRERALKTLFGCSICKIPFYRNNKY